MDWLELGLDLTEVKLPPLTEGLQAEIAEVMWKSRLDETLPDHQDCPDFFEDVDEYDQSVWFKMARVAWLAILLSVVEGEGIEIELKGQADETPTPNE